MVEVDTNERRYDHHADPVISVRCFLPCGEGLRCRNTVSCIGRVSQVAVPVEGLFRFPTVFVAVPPEEEAPVFPEPRRDVSDLNHLQILLFKKFWRTVSSFSPFRSDRRVRFSRFSRESQALASASFWMADSTCVFFTVDSSVRIQRLKVISQTPSSLATAQRGRPADHAAIRTSALALPTGISITPFQKKSGIPLDSYGTMFYNRHQ